MFKHSGQTQTPFKCKDTVLLFWWTLSASGEDSSALAATLGTPVSYARNDPEAPFTPTQPGLQNSRAPQGHAGF